LPIYGVLPFIAGVFALSDLNDVQITATGWWKASEYEVVGGTHIVPSEGSSPVPYEPFEDHGEFWGGKTRQGEAPPPYAELDQIDRANPWEVVEWCNRHGLLGILPHQTIEANFCPWWKEKSIPTGGGVGQSILSSSATTGAVPAQIQYRQNYGSDEVDFDFSSRTWDYELRPLTEEEVEDIRAKGWEKGVYRTLELPSVRKLNVWSGTIEGDNLVSGYARFFPRVDGVTDWEVRQNWGGWFPEEQKPRSLLGPDEEAELRNELEQNSYPLPFSPEFLQQYGEPIHLFKHYADILLQSVKIFEGVRSARSQEEVRERFSYNGDRETLLLPSQMAGLRPAHPSAGLVSDEEATHGFRWSRRWRIPSLYAGLHKMILDDFAFKGASAKYCKKCDKMFVTDNPRQKYCTGKCRHAFHQAKWRASLKV